jgi:gamma-glutamylcyclotransferase (GGCT)/AIG2-like uncharacterized protein YtfP
MPSYFAYGSNMHSGTLRERRGVRFTDARAARAPGWRLVFDKPGLLPTGEAFANVIPDPAAEVFGVLFQISASDLAHVDLTEGVLIGNYRRVEVSVITLCEPALTAPAYTLTSDRRGSGLLPTTRYMSILVAGALEHQLPAEYIEFLRRVPARSESPEAARLRPMMDAFMRKKGEP